MTQRTSDASPTWTIETSLTEQSGYFRRVIEHMPTPLVIVDSSGMIVYANEALCKLGNWTPQDGTDTNLLEFVHPDDAAGIVEAFLLLAGGSAPTPDRSWAPINLRLVSASGDVIPAEVTGRDMLGDADAPTVVYEVRPAYEHDVFHRVMTGVASSGTIETQLDLVMQLFAATPLDIDSIVVCIDEHDRQVVVATSGPRLRTAFENDDDQVTAATFGGACAQPAFVDVAGISGRLGEELGAYGYCDAWSIEISSPISGRRYRLVAFTPEHHDSAIGVTDRLVRAGELASIVLLRAHSEELLTHAAHHDQLTELPNRHGLLERLRTSPVHDGERGVLFIDLDGFKVVNDRHGHETGDEVLRILAQRLEATTRPGDVVSRIGGDEFAVVMGPTPVSTTLIAAEALSSRILQAISENISTRFGDIEMGASIGINIVESDSDIQAAISGADQAMYVAKRAGGRRSHLGRAETGAAPRHHVKSG
jgi:diguanylate cyclase (GGDEF)-like protein/PAS domain S-box-containing protein